MKKNNLIGSFENANWATHYLTVGYRHGASSHIQNSEYGFITEALDEYEAIGALYPQDTDKLIFKQHGYGGLEATYTFVSWGEERKDGYIAFDNKNAFKFTYSSNPAIQYYNGGEFHNDLAYASILPYYGQTIPIYLSDTPPSWFNGDYLSDQAPIIQTPYVFTGTITISDLTEQGYDVGKRWEWDLTTSTRCTGYIQYTDFNSIEYYIEGDLSIFDNKQQGVDSYNTIQGLLIQLISLLGKVYEFETMKLPTDEQSLQLLTAVINFVQENTQPLIIGSVTKLSIDTAVIQGVDLIIQTYPSNIYGFKNIFAANNGEATAPSTTLKTRTLAKTLSKLKRTIVKIVNKLAR